MYSFPGKSTLVSYLTERLGTETVTSPPPSLREVRKHFDSQPELVRRAYYALGNYLVAQDVRELTRDKPVVMDRCVLLL